MSLVFYFSLVYVYVLSTTQVKFKDIGTNDAVSKKETDTFSASSVVTMDVTNSTLFFF